MKTIVSRFCLASAAAAAAAAASASLFLFAASSEISTSTGAATARSAPAADLSSSVSIVKNFLLPSETNLYRHNENKYDHIPAVGFSGDRTWGGAYLPRSFLRRLIDVGAKQCPTIEYEDSLPNGIHILTNFVKETTDPHLDINPTTSKHINNDVGVVFLNTNKDAVFIVGNEEFPIEEGTLITFPGGSVPHHIEMKKKKGGFVHMLGPFEVGGSHGTVGQTPRSRLGATWLANWPNVNNNEWKIMHAPVLTESPSVQPSSNSGSKSGKGKGKGIVKEIAQQNGNGNGKASKKNGKARKIFH